MEKAILTLAGLAAMYIICSVTPFGPLFIGLILVWVGASITGSALK